MFLQKRKRANVEQGCRKEIVGVLGAEDAYITDWISYYALCAHIIVSL